MGDYPWGEYFGRPLLFILAAGLVLGFIAGALVL